MRTSIRFRLLLILNVVVLTTVGALGYLAAQVAGDVVEERLVSEVAQNTAGLLESQQVPLTDTLMGQLKQLFDVEFAIVRSHDRTLIATSLPEDLRPILRDTLAASDIHGSVQIGPERYRVGINPVRRANVSDPGPPVQICALVPAEQFQDARRRASRQIGLIALLAAVGASGLTLLLSRTITRPLRSLASEMDHTAAGDDALAEAPHDRRGPAEVVRLAASFDALIERLGAAQTELAQAERLAALGKVAASAVHELRNPLSGIKMNGRILQDELRQSGLATESLDLMLQEVERMDLYLQELMNLARPGKSPPPTHDPTVTRCQIAEVAANVLELLGGRFRHGAITVEADMPPLPRPARIDPIQLRQVLMNLLINAVQAMPHGGVIRLSVSAGTNTIRLTVTDSGTGVSVADGQDIFDAFITGKPNGAGLGLYLCRQVVNAHGGRIGYTSSSTGTTFTVDLPATEAVE